MGMFDGFKVNLAGNKALRAHQAAQQAAKKGDDKQMDKQYELAKVLYEEALEMGCEMPKVYMSYSILLMRDGELERAKELMLKAYKNPALADVEKKQLMINYGVCQWKLGNIDKAIELLRSAEQKGKSSAIYIMLGHLLLEKAEQTGNFSECEPYIQEAYEYDEDDAEGIDLMGQLHLAKGDLAKAKEFFGKAIEKDEKQGWSYVYLAKIAKQEGDAAAEKQYMEKAVKAHFHLMSPFSKLEARDYAKKLGISAE